MADPDVSVLLPVFDGAKFLKEQMLSVLSQTHKNLELLVIDDGSTDESWDVITQAARTDERIKSQRSRINLGQERSLEILAERCTSPLVMLCDQDDIWHPEKIHHLMSAIGECSMAYGPSPLINAAGEDLERTLFDAVGPPIEGVNQLEVLFRNSTPAHASLMKRSMIFRGAFRSSVGGVMFDWRPAAAACFASGLRFASKAITWHRIHEANRTSGSVVAGAPRIRRSHRQHLDSLRELTGFLASHPSIVPQKRTVFSVLFDELQRHDARQWRISDYHIRASAAQAASDLGADAASIAKFNKKIARIARGRLHPAFWWGEMRATTRSL